MAPVNSQKQLAEALGVAKQRLSEWKQRGAPIPSKGPYDVQQVLLWAKANLERSPLCEESPGVIETSASLRLAKLKAEVELKQTLAEQEKIKLGLLRGKYVDVEEFRTEMRRWVGVVRQYLLSMPKALAGDLIGLSHYHEAEGILRKYVYDLLESLSQGREFESNGTTNENSTDIPSGESVERGVD